MISQSLGFILQIKQITIQIMLSVLDINYVISTFDTNYVFSSYIVFLKLVW